jgi:transcriptional regulator with XRE-family HTH domain
LEDHQTVKLYRADVLGEVIRKARVAAGLTQEELAARARLSRNYISLLEHDQRSVTVVALMRIGRVVGVPASKMIAAVEKNQRG